MKFRTILADCPWEYVYWTPGGNGRRATDHYVTQRTRWIARLPVEEVAEKDCTLLLWGTNPKLPDAFYVMDAWGFEYKSMVTWVKMSRAAAPRIGLGFHARACTEHLLIGATGSAGAPKAEDRPNGVFFCPIGDHSAKPSYQYDLAENYPGPWLELFHRPQLGLLEPRDGWTFAGNEVSGLDMREDLLRLASLPAEAVNGCRLAADEPLPHLPVVQPALAWEEPATRKEAS